MYLFLTYYINENLYKNAKIKSSHLFASELTLGENWRLWCTYNLNII